MRSLLFFLLILVLYSCTEQSEFQQYFEDQSMRVDFILVGNADSENIKQQFLHFW